MSVAGLGAFAVTCVMDGSFPGMGRVQEIEASIPVEPVPPEAISALRTAMIEAGFGKAPEAIKPEPVQQVASVAPDVVVPESPEPAPSEIRAPFAMTAQARPAPMTVPLPVRRPSDLVRQASPPLPTMAEVRSARRRASVVAAPPVAPQEEPSLFDRIFGTGKPDKPAGVLAYASLEGAGGGAAESVWRKGVTAVPQTAIVPPKAGGGTAIYDITAKTVQMPNGEVLEAHSGLGEHMDNPNGVHLKMRGATPPGTYDLREREALFHGVRAIRLTPVGGGPALHGRDGLLAHTYMLRSQPGASNGCVVFKDYDRFLQAYLRGEVSRLVVVASR